MPGRRKKIYTDGVYHVFNKTINSFDVFKRQYYAKLFLELMNYYRSSKARVSFSTLRRLPELMRKKILQEVTVAKHHDIRLFSYCLMPTHYHLLIQQRTKNGISKFVSDVINAFTRHFNVRNKRLGPLFLTNFKSVPILSDEQLIHVSRYIHLNPYSNGFVERIDDLRRYPWSSYREYILGTEGLCNVREVLAHFNKSPSFYKKFIEENAEYQKTLECAKYADAWI